MAGVIATLKIWDLDFPGAYVHIDGFSCDLSAASEQYPDGIVSISRKYFYSKDRFDANPNDFVVPQIDPMPQLIFPHVRHSDPIDVAIVQLKEWLPDAVEV